MKLKQLLKSHFDINGMTSMGRGISDYILTPEILTVYLEELNKCVEFGGASITIIPEVKSGKPKKVLQGYDEEGIPMCGVEFETTSPDGEVIITHKLGSTTKFAPTVKLYSISLTPEIFDPADIFKTKLDTVCIAPTVYDPENFTPSKRLIITFSPEQAQDAALKILKKEIREIEKDEEKPEFVVITEPGNDQEKQIKDNVEEAKDIMETVTENEIKTKLQEQENQYIEKLVGMVQECFRNPGEHQMPCKRGILVRATANSFVDNTSNPVITMDPADTFVQLK